MFPYELEYREYGDGSTYITNTETFACKKCCHIEWFVNEDAIQIAFQQYEHNRKHTIEHKKKLTRLKIKKSNLENKINKLNNIISDENQTVKTVNEAKLKLQSLINELSNLK